MSEFDAAEDAAVGPGSGSESPIPGADAADITDDANDGPLTVGDVVQLALTLEPVTPLCLEPGESGVIVGTDTSDIPFRVRGPRGESNWFVSFPLHLPTPLMTLVYLGGCSQLSCVSGTFASPMLITAIFPNNAR
jgi:hypothetical protein